MGNTRKTKIVCTIGPATESPDMIRGLIQAGMNVARLNFSHGNHESHRRTIRTLRQISKELGREVGILQDLRGTKIRIGQLPASKQMLKTNETVFLSCRQYPDPHTIPIDYPHLMEDVSAGERILLADGAVELLIKAKSNNLLTAKVVAGGVIHSHKGVNFPSSPLRIPAFTEKDQADLALGLEEQVDFVALSFVRHERDLEPFSQIINQQKHKPLLIVKIEKSQAVEHFAAILERVDGVMVARGDLGVEMLFEKVPHIQKKIIGIVRKSGKPVITATQMLLSMTENPRPTRAEATDAANAILDGTDAIMLSEETAIGRFPRESVQVPDRITRETEPNIDGDSFLAEQAPNTLPPTPTAISRSACWLARDLRAAVILAFTSSGGTARLVSRFRPPYPIIALTPNLLTQRQLTLSWGIYPSAIPAFTDSDKLFSVAKSWILNNGMGKKGDRIILIAGIPLGTPGKTNLLKVIKLE